LIGHLLFEILLLLPWIHLLLLITTKGERKGEHEKETKHGRQRDESCGVVVVAAHQDGGKDEGIREESRSDKAESERRFLLFV